MKPRVRELSAFSDAELLDLRITLDKEFKKRTIRFTVGEIGEKLIIEFFKKNKALPNLLTAPRGTKNVDALSRDGDRYSIKTIQSAKKTGTIYPDREEKDKQLFEFLLIVKIDDNYTIEHVYQFSWTDFLNVRAWDKRMSAWYIPFSQKALSLAKKII